MREFEMHERHNVRDKHRSSVTSFQSLVQTRRLAQVCGGAKGKRVNEPGEDDSQVVGPWTPEAGTETGSLRREAQRLVYLVNKCPSAWTRETLCRTLQSPTLSNTRLRTEQGRQLLNERPDGE